MKPCRSAAGSAEDEPALWQKDLTGLIEWWIEVGLPDERVLRQACGRAKQVCVYTYGGRPRGQWWKENVAALERLNNLTVMNLSPEGAGLWPASHSVRWSCTARSKTGRC